jgi:ribonuclease HII
MDAGNLYQHDIAIISGHQPAPRVAGVDEAGRGPLAGPVVAAAVILDLDVLIDGVNDSKKLGEKRRGALYGEIVKKAKAYGVGMSSPEEIDEINILQATFLAMRRALENLGNPENPINPENLENPNNNKNINSRYDLLLVDGNQYISGIPRESQKIITGGDAKSASIAAASIIAKVTRDRIMEKYDEEYPLYGFKKHKGYGTEYHRAMIKQYGFCDIHRKSFVVKDF